MTTLEKTTAYCYQNLQDPSLHFRLIEMHPGKFDDDIKLSIYHESLVPSRKPQRSSETSNRIYFYYENDQGDWASQWTHPHSAFDLSPYQISQQRNSTAFEALSYTWGTSTESRTALVVPRFSDPQSEPVKTISIGVNLECALRYLRLPDRVRTLWVDAVCINQNNISERDEQVKRMATIYKEAARVVVWLGPESESSTLAIKTLAFLGQQIVMTMDKWTFTAPGATEIDWCYNRTPLPYDKKTWRAINSLLQRSWFSRVWIVQEIQLAKDAILRCGHDEIAWVEFRRAILALWGKSSLDPAISRRRLGFIEKLVNPVTSTSTIYHILHRTDDRGCSNKRDRVYGVMGLFSETFRARIQPQYFLGVGEVYRDFVCSHIQHVKRLELLRDCQLEGRAVDAPSWVPDFSVSKSTVKSADWQFASGYSACEVSFADERRMVVAGVYCGEVGISREIPNYRSQRCQCITIQDSVKAIREITEWIKLRTSADSISWHAFARTITGNYLKDRFPENTVEPLQQWESYLEASSIFSSSSDLSDVKEETFSFHEEFSLHYSWVEESS
uniref:Heterokaryon incompatibility domain-containing protein n=1 Tax=Bionectria ochroleuca TaxID=29856 RepID=A0A0B7K7P8_BIOOC